MWKIIRTELKKNGEGSSKTPFSGHITLTNTHTNTSLSNLHASTKISVCIKKVHIKSILKAGNQHRCYSLLCP